MNQAHSRSRRVPAHRVKLVGLRVIALVGAGATVLAGCSNVLGYEDLSFDENRTMPSGGPVRAEPPATVVGGAGADGGGFTEDGGPVTELLPDGGTRPREVTLDGSSVDATVGACANKTCGSNQFCEPTSGACVCSPGFVSNGSGACAAAPPGDPATHSSADVCASWKTGHTLSDSQPWTRGAQECDPGTLSQGGINDTLARLAMFRWMVGLAPVVENVAGRGDYMACGAVASWNPPGGSFNPHAPPPTAKCYTAAGAAGAGSANLGWGGRVPADAIDQFMEDSGNDTTFGHRRWIMNPPLGAVGIGFYAGGGPYGSAQCLGVFDSSGSGPSPAWVSFPPPGFVPIEAAAWAWSFHHQSGAATTMTVTRGSDGAVLPMTTLPLQAGYGSYAVTAFRPQGWAAAPGETYLVSVEGATPSPITYTVKPVSCP